MQDFMRFLILKFTDNGRGVLENNGFGIFLIPTITVVKYILNQNSIVHKQVLLIFLFYRASILSDSTCVLFYRAVNLLNRLFLKAKRYECSVIKI